MKEKQLQRLQAEVIENVTLALSKSFEGFLKDDTIALMSELIEHTVMGTFYGFGVPAHNHLEK